ncbi:MAG: hypothetical protein Aurels2KO_36710 [Aureliella sp.]
MQKQSILGWGLIVCFATTSLLGADPQHQGSEILEYSMSFQIPELKAANRFALSRDGKHLYCAAWRAGTIVSFEKHGVASLEHIENTQDPLLAGVLKLALNGDGSVLACVCMRSNRISMFGRDKANGVLTMLGSSEASLLWPVALSFSPDGKFLYVADAGGSSSSNAPSSLVVFDVSDPAAVREIARYDPEGAVGLRNVLVSADGKNCYATCSTSGMVIVYERDKKSGELRHLQTNDLKGSGATMLDGVHSCKVSHSGKRLYCISGRFRGVSGITVFERQSDGRLALARELKLESEEFSGGNDIVVSKDESLVIASGTTGNSIAIVQQDLSEPSLQLHSTLVNSGKINLLGVSGLQFGHDEDDLFVAAEDGSAVTAFFVK